jgi:hypothetical protein
MNYALRQGRYSPDLWREFTGLSVQDLWSEYIKSLPESTTVPRAEAPAETPSPAPAARRPGS